MTHYALPWPPDADPPVDETGGDQLGLWAPTCLHCRGSGVVLVVSDEQTNHRAECPQCHGSGIAALDRDWPRARACSPDESDQ